MLALLVGLSLAVLATAQEKETAPDTNVVRLLKDAGLVFLSILAIIFLWTRYNYLWFLRRGERRGGQVRISSDVEMSGMLDTDLNAMEDIRRSRRLEIRVDGPKYRITAKE